MASFFSIAFVVALRFLWLLSSPTLIASAAPASYLSLSTNSSTASSSYWLASIKRQGSAPFNADAGYKVFRNVKDFGAQGDGTTDDTDAINQAVSAGTRCGQGCDSSTTSPALVYFPPGTYLVSKPIIQLYYTQFVGDAIDIPTLKAAASFQGMAVIDSDPYTTLGYNWYTNQNNFFRQVRNFVIDITAMPSNKGAGIHWQVAQATSLQNIRFEMVRGGGNNKQQGIFMDNGSGGFMTDLVFNGGNYGAFLGNQQFTTRNLTFNNCNTAIYMNWNWAWTFKSLSINNCAVGIDMSNSIMATGTQLVGSVLVLDSTFFNTPMGVKTAFGSQSLPTTGGTLIIDNVDFTSCQTAVADPSGTAILAGGSVVASWGQGREYSSQNTAGTRVQGVFSSPPAKPTSLLDPNGKVFERPRPQYQQHHVDSFVSVKSNGAKGDGKTDDTVAIQAIINKAAGKNGIESIVYFDHGAYVISDTITIPPNSQITGEMWPLILASGTAFQDESNPKPVFQVGAPGDTGSVELTDLILETVGPQPGAILVEWNIRDPAGHQGASGMWDVHFRIGGTAGTNLQSDKCAKNPDVTAPAKPECEAAFLLLHVTQEASIYLENNWFWVADHELDLTDHSQINVFNGRGVLVESVSGPVWMYGTSSEHNQLYNYQIANAKNVYMALIQTETPYYQGNPSALTPFKANPTFSDPTFSHCATSNGVEGNSTSANCARSWGLRVLNSSQVYTYGAGLYSFFDNYGQTCLDTESCQQNMVSIEGSSDVHLFGLSTKASTYMVTLDEAGVVPQAENRDNFCSTLALFQSL